MLRSKYKRTSCVSHSKWCLQWFLQFPMVQFWSGKLIFSKGGNQISVETQRSLCCSYWYEIVPTVRGCFLCFCFFVCCVWPLLDWLFSWLELNSFRHYLIQDVHSDFSNPVSTCWNHKMMLACIRSGSYNSKGHSSSLKVTEAGRNVSSRAAFPFLLDWPSSWLWWLCHFQKKHPESHCCVFSHARCSSGFFTPTPSRS